MRTRTGTAAIIVAALALSLAPAATASHGGEGGQLVPDGFVTLGSAENALEQDNSIIVSPDDGDYVFHTKLYDDSGNAVDFDSLGWAVFTVDAVEENGITPADVAENPDDYSRFSEAGGTSDNVDDDNEATFRVPTSALGFGSVVTENGLAVFSWAQDEDTNGGAVSLAAQQHAKEGNWEEADEADQQWTPVFVHTTDADDLVEPNQPVFNPDFSVGDTTGQEVESPQADSGSGEAVVAPTAAPPWAAHVTQPGQFPESSTELAAVDGGTALQVNVDGSDIQDPDDTLYVVQQFSDGTEAFPERQDEAPFPLQWKTPEELEASVRLPEDQAVDSVNITISVEWASDSGEDRITEVKKRTVLASDTFETISLDLEDRNHPDRNLSRVWLGIDRSGAHDDTTIGAGFSVQFDDARLRGADHEPVRMHSSISDGYAVHIKPVDASDLDRDRNAVNVDAFETVNDKRYLFEVSVWDTRTDEKVDPAEFEAESFQVGRADPTTGDTSAGGDLGFTYLDSQVTSLDFAQDDARLVVLDAEAIPAETTTSAWYWAHLEDGTPPQDAAGYYSVLKNQFEGFAAADQLDWAANPVRFTNATTADYTFDSRVTDFTEDESAGTSTATVTSDSPVLEPVTVNLLDSDGNVVATQESAPIASGVTDTVSFDTDIPENGAIAIEAGEVTESSQLDLGPPEVEIGDLGTDLDDGTALDLPVATLMDPDPDPAITSAHWEITVDNPDGTLTETIEVEDENDDGTISASEAEVAGYQFPDHGTATVALLAEDNDGDVGSDSVTVTVDNAPPAFSSDLQVLSPSGDILVGDDDNNAWEVQAGGALVLRSAADDPTPEGDIASATIEVEAIDVGVLTQDDTRLTEDNLTRTFDLTDGLVHEFSPPSPGTYDVVVNWTDDDGDSTTTTGVIDAKDPNVAEQATVSEATFGGEVAGETPLAGETLEATVDVVYEGDRPDVDESLTLVAPDDTVVAADTTKTYDATAPAGTRMAATYTLEAPVDVAGTYTLNLTGTTYTGAALEDAVGTTIEVDADSAPSASPVVPDRDTHDGDYYAEIGEEVAVEAGAADADCVDDGPRCDLSFSWALTQGAGDVAADGNSSVFTPSEASADADTPHLVEVTVTDHLGASTTATVPVVVDDRLELRDVDFVSQGDAATGDLSVSGQVTDDLGNGQDALLTYVLRYSPNVALADQGVSRVADEGSLTLPSDGSFDLDLDSETAGFEKAGYYEVTLTAQEPYGRIDRPDQGPNQDGSQGDDAEFEETVTGVFSAQFGAGQAAGTTTVVADGRCTYDGQGGQDSAALVVDGERVPPHTIVYPDAGEAQDGLAACLAAAQNGETPDGGSHGGVTVSAQGEEVEASTVPVSDAVTEAAPKTGEGDGASVTAEGACWYDGDGAEDRAQVAVDTSGTFPPHTLIYPSTADAEAGILACLAAAQNGETPDGGSHATVTVDIGGEETSVSTVPASDALTELGLA